MYGAECAYYVRMVHVVMIYILLQYVEDPRFDKLKVHPITVLHQAAKGLTFLHSIGISKPLQCVYIVCITDNELSAQYSLCTLYISGLLTSYMQCMIWGEPDLTLRCTGSSYCYPALQQTLSTLSALGMQCTNYSSCFYVRYQTDSTKNLQELSKLWPGGRRQVWCGYNAQKKSAKKSMNNNATVASEPSVGCMPSRGSVPGLQT